MSRRRRKEHKHPLVLLAVVALIGLYMSFSGDAHGREITIVTTSSTGADTYIDESLPTANFGTNTTMDWGDNFDTRYMFMEFQTISDSILGDSTIDSMIMGFVVNAVVGADATDTLDVMCHRLVRATAETEMTWDSALVDPAGDAWATAGAGNAGADIGSEPFSDSIKVNGGAWAAAIDKSTVSVGDTIWFKVMPTHTDSVINNWWIRFAWSSVSASPNYIRVRTVDHSVDRPRVRLWTSGAAATVPAKRTFWFRR